MSDFVYNASTWQNAYHARTEREVLGGGSAGPGKSLCLIMDPIPKIVEEHRRCADKNHPYHMRWGSSSGCTLFLRREYPMLEETIRRSRRIFPLVDPGCEYSASAYTWTFSSGYRYRFGHCNLAGDWEKYYSDEYDQVNFDELRQFTLEQYEQISSRVRSSDPVLSKSLKVRGMTNPGPCLDENNPQWVRQRFVDPAPDGNVVLRQKLVLKSGDTVYNERVYMPATLYHNPDPDFIKQYETTLLARPPHIRQMLLYGNWYAAVGAFFGEDWNPDVHVVEPFTVPHDWPIMRAMDWGYRTRGVIGWFAQDYDGNLYCIREFSFKELTATEVAQAVREYESRMGWFKRGRSIITGPADTQLWEKRGESGMSKADEFARVGIQWQKADKTSRARNAEHVLGRLKASRKGTPKGIVFFKTCTGCIQTIPVLSVDPGNSEVPEKGGDDHWYDMVSYACNYASRGVRSLPKSVERGDDDDFEIEHSRIARGQYGYGSEVE